MKDFRGVELRVGDRVLFVDRVNKYAGLQEGVIKKFYKNPYGEDECTVNSKTHVQSFRVAKLDYLKGGEMTKIKISEKRGIFYVCPKCSDEVVLGQNYCGECGEPIEWMDDREKVKE